MQEVHFVVVPRCYFDLRCCEREPVLVSTSSTRNGSIRRRRFHGRVQGPGAKWHLDKADTA